MRIYTDITILRPNEGEVATVPITAAARRRWRLMSEDSITLEFNLATPAFFQIGDYVNDELFGLFYITKEPTPPEYNKQTGGYKYTLQFDRDYFVWGNKVFQLTYAGEQAHLSAGISRKETSFTITDRLEVHVQEVIRNLFSLGYTIIGGDGCFYCRYGYCIDGETKMVLKREVVGDAVTFSFVEAPAWWAHDIPDFEGVRDAKAMATVSYDGTNIIDALTNGMCSPYECEWWVLEDFLCLGKCEFGQKIDFRLDKDVPSDVINVETLTPNRNEKDFANRLFVFGGTKNIPDTYGKELIFNITDEKEEGGVTLYRDSTRILRREYIDTYFYKWVRPVVSSSYTQYGNRDTFEVDLGNFWIPYTAGTINAYVASGVVVNFGSNAPSYTSRASINYSLYLGTELIFSGQAEATPRDGGTFALSIELSRTLFEFIQYTPNASLHFEGEVVIDDGAYHVNSIDASGETTIELDYGFAVARLACKTREGDYAFTAHFEETENGNFDYFEPESYDPSEIDFQPGLMYYILPATENNHGIIEPSVPSSWYISVEGDINSNRILGEKRLSLPQDTPYIGDDLPNEQVVEKVVVFDNIFPKCGLRICGLHAAKETIDWSTYADGSIQQADAVNYFIALERITENGDVEFPFNNYNGFPDMRLPGEGLQIKFLTEDEAKAYGPLNPAYTPQYMLSGLTFNVGIYKLGGLIQFEDDETGELMYGYQIERTEEYKTYLPNEVMKPTKGDALVLSGWNPNYMAELGLIETAENELKQAGEDYHDLLEYEQFTFDCSMMSDWARSVGILPFGQQARVYYKALKEGYKDSRVIGYELKLDIPEDSPVYTIGETEAYSRLRAMEQKLEAERRESSSSGVISAGGGGEIPSSGDVSWEAESNTEIGLQVNAVAHTLLKTEAIDLTDKKVEVLSNADIDNILEQLGIQ